MPNPNGPANTARNQLLSVEVRRQAAVITEFEKIRDRLESQLKSILEIIEKERRIDGNASPQSLFEKTRLSELLDQVEDEIEKISDRLAALTSTGQNQAIEIAKSQAEKYAQLSGNLTFFDSEATRELIGIASNGRPLAKHFATLAARARQAMFDALFFGIATGTPGEQIAREVRSAIGGTRHQAMTIVRTEVNRAYRESSRKYYATVPDCIGWRWLSARDLTTCPVCWGMDGRVFKHKTKFGTHPNCRCTLVPAFEDDPPAITGPEVFAGLSGFQMRAILGPRRFELYAQGADLRDFIETNKSVFGIGRNVKPLRDTTFKPKERDIAGPSPIV